MTHEDKGHYAGKHPGKPIDKTISIKITSLAENNNLPCAAAHKAARDLGVSPSDIGIQTDLMEYRISQCQLGLFGYSPEKKKIDPNIEVSKALFTALDKASSDGKISCSQCWEIADTLKIKRLDLGSACEKINLRIKPCQLGAF
ncbi:MAG: hypothetical protein KKF12_14150 [Proteobacteria bacterium]|nr:hypothetical protein [Desulfobacula sp.]MBU4131958.1 hypothetical protein [Pseudomonadota bacterium]